MPSSIFATPELGLPRAFSRTVLVGLMIFAVALAPTGSAVAQSSVVIGFSPGLKSPSAEEVVIGAIRDARKSLRIAAFSFTSKRIATELVAAHERGIDVRIVADDGAAKGKYSATTFCANKGVAVRQNSSYAIMHNKFIVVDGVSVETGSFNFTQAAAKSNAENAIYIKNNPAVAAQYTTEWGRLWSEGTAIAPRY